VSTADLQIVVSGVDWLALIAAGWSLVYFQRILLAASPKPQPAAGNDSAADRGKAEAAQIQTAAAARETGS
jgi:hypothetical protein